MEDLKQTIEDILCGQALEITKIQCIETLCQGVQKNHSSFVEEILVRVLRHDKNSVIRHEAAFALGRLCASQAISGHMAVDALCKSANEDLSLLVRHEAVESLGFVPHPNALKTLSVLLNHPDSDISQTAEIALQRQFKGVESASPR